MFIALPPGVRLNWRSMWLREKRSLALIRLIKISMSSSEHPSPKQSTRSLNLSASLRGLATLARIRLDLLLSNCNMSRFSLSCVHGHSLTISERKLKG